MKINAVVTNVNIRGCEEKTNKNGEGYLLVRFEDESGRPCELVDKDLSRKRYYKRDENMHLTISIDQGSKFTTIRIIEAEKFS